jgi:hypothetical protein
VGITQIELSVNAEMDFMMQQMAASGLLRINKEGVVGSLQLAMGAAAGGFGFDLFALSGTFQLEINLTDSFQTIQTLDISETGRILGLKEGVIDPWTARVMFGGNLTLFEILQLKGYMEMTLSPEGLELDMAMILDLSLMGEITVDGAAAILYTENGPVFAMRVEANVNLGVPSVGINAGALIEFNTGNEEYVGVAANTYHIGLEGNINILSFNMGFKGSISIVDSVFELRVDYARLNFFNFVNVDISGYIRSDGQFSLKGAGQCVY